MTIALPIDNQRFMKIQANRIQSLMLKDHIGSRKELAEKINRSPSSVTEHMNAKDSISDSFLQQLQVKLGWSAEWIRDGSGPERITTRIVEIRRSVDPDQTTISQHKGKGNRINYQSEVTEGVDPDKIRLETENQMLRERLEECNRLIDKLLNK